MMLRHLKRFHSDERGMAMIVALMVAFVILMLSTVVVAQSIHSLDASGYDRRRLTSVNAAEGGLNFYYSYFEQTGAGSLSCSAVTQTLDVSPGTASFTATPTYYNAAGATMSCPISASNPPAGALINSVGSASNSVPRTMQTYVRLSPITGPDAAILSGGGLSLGNSLTLNGNSGNDADIYVNTGNFTNANSSVVSGNVYVPAGTATFQNSSIVRGDLWSNGSIAGSGSASVGGNATSSTSSIALSHPSSITGNAKAGTTITAGAGAIGGTRTPNTPSSAPPSEPVPQVDWVASEWTGAGYTVQSFSDCTSARTYILSNPSGNNVVRITAVCSLSFGNNLSSTFNGNLAIVTDGSISMGNSFSWTGSAGATRSLHFIAAYRSGLDCATGSYDVSESNNVTYNNVNVFFYSPCTVTIRNNTTMSGQIFAANVVLTNAFTMNYRPMITPGVSTAGFDQDIAYVREV